MRKIRVEDLYLSAYVPDFDSNSGVINGDVAMSNGTLSIVNSNYI